MVENNEMGRNSEEYLKHINCAREAVRVRALWVDKPAMGREKEDMTKDEIRERIAMKPFQPFKVRLADGHEIEVPTGDHAHLHPSGRTLFVHLAHGGTKIIDVALVTALEVMETA
jgi:hypothetical protein